jgi:hypothetical protein
VVSGQEKTNAGNYGKYENHGSAGPITPMIPITPTLMRRSRKPLQIPQWEFGFAPKTFNLIQDTGIDFARVARDREQAEQARQQAEAAQSRLFPQPSTLNSQP